MTTCIISKGKILSASEMYEVSDKPNSLVDVLPEFFFSSKWFLVHAFMAVACLLTIFLSQLV